MRTKKKRGASQGNIPIKEIKLIVDKYVYAEEFALKPTQRNQDEYWEHLHKLACKSRVNPDTLGRIFRNPSRKYIDFDIADRLICGMGLTHMWWGQLEDIYNAADIRFPSKVKPWIEPTESRVCPWCSRRFTAHTRTGSSSKLHTHCSQTCQTKNKSNTGKPRKTAYEN
jgi:hypothetical protein